MMKKGWVLPPSDSSQTIMSTPPCALMKSRMGGTVSDNQRSPSLMQATDVDDVQPLVQPLLPCMSWQRSGVMKV